MSSQYHFLQVEGIYKYSLKYVTFKVKIIKVVLLPKVYFSRKHYITAKSILTNQID